MQRDGAWVPSVSAAVFSSLTWQRKILAWVVSTPGWYSVDGHLVHVAGVVAHCRQTRAARAHSAPRGCVSYAPILRTRLACAGMVIAVG
jgi:hypothetical protein